MTITIDIQPPSPNMQPRELLQWQQRIYKALQEVVVESETPSGVTDHNDLDNNGGVDSHTKIVARFVVVENRATSLEDRADTTDTDITSLEARADSTDTHLGVVDNHIADDTVHGVSGKVVGTTDNQNLNNKTIDADNNTLRNLKHGLEVDNRSSGVHGVSGDVVGTTDNQSILNKTIDATKNTLTNLRHGEEVDNPISGVHGVGGFVVGTSYGQVIRDKSYRRLIRVTSSAIALSEYEHYIQVKASPCVVTLPYADAYIGKIYKVDNSSAGSITLDPQTGDTIQGVTSQSIPMGSCIEVISDGVNWRII